MSLTSIVNMNSALSAAQRGLQVTGQNLTNINTKGYTRQQLLLSDSHYKVPSKGIQVGTGVSIDEVRQIRSEITDVRVRQETSILNYYSAQKSAIDEIETILDEPHGASLSGVLNNMWSQTQKLAINPSGVEERLSFIQTCSVLAKRINHITDSVKEYQEHINNKIIEGSNKVNELLSTIKEMNDIIAKAEINGDKANDYRDERNLAIDELATHLDIKYYEDPSGRVAINAEGRNILSDGFVAKIELVQTNTPDCLNSSFVKPIWSDTETDVFDLSKQIATQFGNDAGGLKGLLVVRGNAPADIDTEWDTIALNNNFSVDTEGNSFLIPKLQKKLAEFAQALIETMNEAFSKGTGQGAYKGEQGVPIFVPLHGDELKAGNITINPLLLENGGYNRLATSLSGDIDDTKIVEDFLKEWSTPREWFAGGTTSPINKCVSFVDFYAEYVTEVGNKGSSYNGKLNEKNTLVVSLENDRLSMSAVSQDEELSLLLQYQHAYNAASRVITIMDGMLETMINMI